MRCGPRCAFRDAFESGRSTTPPFLHSVVADWNALRILCRFEGGERVGLGVASSPLSSICHWLFAVVVGFVGCHFRRNMKKINATITKSILVGVKTFLFCGTSPGWDC